MSKDNELKVKKSTVSYPGTARLNPDTLKNMKIKAGGKIKLINGENSVTLKVETARGAELNDVRLNEEDMDLLGANEEEKVKVMKVSLISSFRERLGV